MHYDRLMRIFIPLLLFLVACSTKLETPKTDKTSTDFAPGEVILAWEYLNKVFDQEISPTNCVPDKDEASLLLRTLNPRMEVVQDDIEALLDDEKAISHMIKNCRQDCTCHYLEDLLREHLVTLTKEQQLNLDQQQKQRDRNSCLRFIQETFCQSELYKALENEKKDFSFEE